MSKINPSHPDLIEYTDERPSKLSDWLLLCVQCDEMNEMNPHKNITKYHRINMVYTAELDRCNPGHSSCSTHQFLCPSTSEHTCQDPLQLGIDLSSSSLFDRPATMLYLHSA